MIICVLERCCKTECETVAGRHLAAHTTNAEQTFALFAIAQLETGGTVGVAHADIVVVADTVFVGILVAGRDEP